jgi:hypothetical protein
MSPLSLSAPSSSQAYQKNQACQRMRFGAGKGQEQATSKQSKQREVNAESDTAKIRKNDATAPVEDAKQKETAEKKTPVPPSGQPSKPGLLSRMKERFGQFFHYIGKAFAKLFGPQKSKTELEKELKQFKHLMKPEKMKSLFLAEAKAIQEKGSTKDKERFAEALEASKTDEGLNKFLDENIQKPFTIAFKLMNEQILKPFAPEEG